MRGERFDVEYVFRFGNFPETVRVGIDEAGQFHPAPRAAFDEFESEMIVERAQNADQTVGLLVDMRREMCIRDRSRWRSGCRSQWAYR